MQIQEADKHRQFKNFNEICKITYYTALVVTLIAELALKAKPIQEPKEWIADEESFQEM